MEHSAGPPKTLPVDAADLADRWRRARLAALRSLVAWEPEADELTLLGRLTTAEDSHEDPVSESEEAVDRAVLINSYRLGQSLRRYLGRPLTLEEVAELLPRLGLPCVAAPFAIHEDHARLERVGCPQGQLEGTCDYFRDAISGLVHGLGEELHHARHRSVGHGDPQCVDVIYRDAESLHRFGAIPPSMQETLDQVVASVCRFDSRRRVRFLGLSEGVLYFQAEIAGAPELAVAPAVQREVARRLPTIRLVEVTPRPVLAD